MAVGGYRPVTGSSALLACTLRGFPVSLLPPQDAPAREVALPIPQALSGEPNNS